MRRALVTAVAALAALMGTAALAGAQAPLAPPLPTDEALSANVQNFVNTGLAPAPYLTTAAASGWPGARGDAFWYQVQPASRTQWDWSKLDAIKAKMDAGGVIWQPILEGSPGWARNASGQSLAVPSPDHIPDFAAFAGAFAQRYGPGGDYAVLHPGATPVTDIEIYNEENARGAGAYTTADNYARIYQAARAAIHAVAPTVRVVVGAILYDSLPATASDPTPTDAEYIRQIFATLAGSGADAIALHPYAPTAIGVAANLHRMQQGLVDAGQAGLPIYVNELGYPAALDGATPKLHAADGPTTDEARAGTVTLLTDALLASDCSIRNIAYFDLVNQENNRADTDYLSSETWKGLERRADGSLTVTGAAFRDAGVRWRADPVAGRVHVCGAAAPPGSAPLPLDLRVDRPSNLCLRPTVTYRGFPVEEATVQVRKDGFKTPSGVMTDATGHLGKDFCVDDPTTYYVQAQVVYAPLGVPVFAQSVAMTCRLGTSAPCAVGADAAPGGGSSGGSGGTGSVGTLSRAGTCLLKSFKVVGSTRMATVLRRGLKVRAGGCLATARTDAVLRRVRIALTVSNATARRLHLTRRRSKTAYTVASASKRVTGVKPVTVVVRFSKRVRARLAHVRRLKLGVGVQLTEGAAKRTLTRHVTLRR